jgi:DNA-binding response OmpR family regulator
MEARQPVRLEAGGASMSQRILVVDDEPDIHVFVGRVLSDAGYQVDSAVDGAEALEKIRESRPDLVLLDLMMPVIDGWEVLARLRGFEDPPPIVVLTARGDFAAFARGVREGVAAFIGKPFHFGDLLTTCSSVLEGVHPAEKVDDERRREQRRRLMVGVRVLSGDRRPLALGELVDLSPGGAQVRLVAPLEVGSSVRLALHISLADSPLQLEGRVQWRRDEEERFAHGLSFANMPPDMEARLRDLFRPPD